MDRTDGIRSSPLFYVNLALAADLILLALILFTGGFAFAAGPLHLAVSRVRVPALILLALLALRRLLLTGGEEGGPWRDRYFGAAGSAKERWRALELLILFTLLFTLLAGIEAVGRYRDLAVDGFGLAAAGQALWNTLEGHFLATSLGGAESYLGLHFSPGLAVFAPLVSWWPSSLPLVWVSLFALALGAWPLYLLVMRDTKDRRWAVALAALYLAHPLLRGAGLSGFDPAVLAVTPLLIAFYLLDEKPRPSGYLFLLLAMSFSEGAWLAASFLGLYLSVARRRWREGLFLFLPTFYGFLFLHSFVMPRFGSPVLPSLGPYAHLGESVGEVLKNVILHPAATLGLVSGPGRAEYLLLVFAPLAFLPLLGPARLAIALPLLVADLLAGDPAYRSVLTPHGPLTVPFLLAAASSGIRRLRPLLAGSAAGERAGTLLAGALLLATLLAFDAAPFRSERPGLPAGFAGEFAAARESISPGASLAAPGPLLPYLCRRRTLRDLTAAATTDFVIVDLERVRRDPGDDGLRERLVSLVASRGLEVTGGGRHVVALGRGEDGGGGREGAKDFQDLLDQEGGP